MKKKVVIKQSPEDFQVEECTDVKPLSEGAFAFYKLEKRGWTTHDALSVVRRRWQLDHRRISYGGLKDRHAQTVQFFTVFHGPRRQLNQQGIAVTYLGQLPFAYTSEHIHANQFTLIVRGLGQVKAQRAMAELGNVRAYGVPNYFDDQRFGSVAHQDRNAGTLAFVAKEILLGRYEAALKLALAAPYAHDRSSQKHEKELLREHWGQWATLKELLPRGHARSLVDYLVHHPDDFRGAVARLRPELRGLYLSAYQSYLWNRMLAIYLESTFGNLQSSTSGPPGALLAETETKESPPESALPCQDEHAHPLHLALGPVPCYATLTDEQLGALRELRLPLPSARAILEESDPRKEALDRVLAAEGLTLEQFKLKGFKEMFFSRGDRNALCLPENLTGEIALDATRAGKFLVRLTFALPRGSYATLIVKRLFGG